MPVQKQSTIRVLRYNSKKEPSTYFQEYTVPFEEGKTIMDALIYIYTHLDSSLAFRVSCQHGWCNVCMIKVNQKVLEPCKTLMLKEMTIEPVPDLPVIHDLIVDRSVKRLRKKH